MQTSLYEITFKDGRVFRVFNANETQFNRFIKAYRKIDANCKLELIKNGIHTTKQFEAIIKTI